MTELTDDDRTRHPQTPPGMPDPGSGALVQQFLAKHQHEAGIHAPETIDAPGGTTRPRFTRPTPGKQAKRSVSLGLGD